MEINVRFLSYRTQHFLGWEMFQTKNCGENQNTHFMFSNFFFSENRAVYVVMRKNIVEPIRPQIAVWRLRVACWIAKAKHTHTHPHTYTHTYI